MALIRPLLACIFTAVVLPKLKAWAQRDIYCHRLVPLQITSVITPCVYPCMLISPHIGPARILLRQEVNGTPCKVTGSHSPQFKVSGSPLAAYQVSQCTNGICQLPHVQLHLKRAKREATHTRKRRGASVTEKARKDENEKENHKNGNKKRRKRRKRRKKKRGKNNTNEAY